MPQRSTYTPLVEEHLQAFAQMQEAETDPFFYTGLQARIDKRRLAATGWSLPLKPAWVIGSLLLLLTVNGLIITRQSENAQPATSVNSTQQGFADVYNLASPVTY
jgi:hypothetical protein